MSATSSGIPVPAQPGGASPQLNQLCLAASKGENETIRELVNNGAKFDPDESGRTALHYAANYGQTVTLKLCLQLGCELDLQDKHGCTALHRAVLDGQIDTVKVLLYEGCAVDRQDENGNTALHEAAWGGYSKVVDLLIKRGKAHIHASNKHGHKPIHLACQNGHNESSRILLRGGGNPNTKNNNGDTPGHVSALFGHITCLRILISAGCNINVKNKDGNTPLHVAAGLGKQKITRVLLEAKCDVNVRNHGNLTAVEMARRNNHAETVLMILSAHRLWRGSMSQHKPRKSKSSKDNKKQQKQDEDDDEVDHAGHPARVKGRREIKGEEVQKRLDARKKTEERILMNENYDKWRELQGVLLKQELRKQADIRGHKHGFGKTSAAAHSDCKVCIQKLENQIEASKEKMMFELETAKARFEHKLRKMDRKIDHQGASMDRLCQERVKAEATSCLHRIDKRAIKERAAWAEENDVRLELVKDDLRGWVEGKLKDVQRQLKVLNEGGGGGKLRVRSKSESDLGTVDSMEETTEVDDDTDEEDIKGIVIGRGRAGSAVEEMGGNDEEMDGDVVEGDESSGVNKDDESYVEQPGSPLRRSRPVMRGRNVRTGKYGKPQVTSGRSRSLDSSQVAMEASPCHTGYDLEHSSSSEDDTGDMVPSTKHVEFSLPACETASNETKSKDQETTEDGSERGRSSQRTTKQSKRTSSFTRAVQHEMWAAAQANAANDSSDGSVRALVEGTYRPPIVVVTDPHRMGSYSSGADGIQPANLSSAGEDSDETLSVTSSDESLITVSRLTMDSSTLTPHASVDQQHSRQPASGQSESSPSASQSSSSPGDAANKPRSDCSKSSSGISSGASTIYSQGHTPMDDMVARASSLNNSTLNKWSLSRGRPSGSRDIPPPHQFDIGQNQDMPQQYVTSKSAYSAQQQLHKTSQPGNTRPGYQENVYAQPGHTAVGKRQTSNQQSTSLSQSGYTQPRQTAVEQLQTFKQRSTSLSEHSQPMHTAFEQLQTSKQQSISVPGYTQPRQTAVVQPPAFRSSKSSQPLAGGSAFAARSLPSHPVHHRAEYAPSNQQRQIPQYQQKQPLQQQQLHQKHQQQQQQLPASHQQYNQGPMTHQSVEQSSTPVRQSYGQVPTRQHGPTSQASAAVHWPSSLQRSDIPPYRPHVQNQQVMPSSHSASNAQDNTISVSRSGQLLRYHQISGSSSSDSPPLKQYAPGQSIGGYRVSKTEMNRNVEPVNSARPSGQQRQPYTQHSVASHHVSSSKPVPQQGNRDNARSARPIAQQTQPSSTHTVPSQVPTGHMTSSKPGAASPARSARPMVQQTRPQTPHMLPPHSSVPPSSIAQKPQAARSHGRMPDASSRPVQSTAQVTSDSSSTTSSASRKTVVRRTYEINL